MGFGSYHPGLNLLFFVAALFTTLYWDHPVYTAISLVAAFALSCKLGGLKGLLVGVVCLLVGTAFAVYYFSFNHFGVTVLAHNQVGNPITLESILYGFEMGAKLAAALVWFSCVLRIFSVDKVVYLVGRVWPKAALMVSVSVRFFPQVGERFRRVDCARNAMGRGLRAPNPLRKLVYWSREVSTVITWVIDRTMEMSDSMRSRGSTLWGRSAYSLYRFDNRDRGLVLVMMALLALVVMGMLLDQMSALYAPMIILNRITPLSYVFFTAYGAFCFLPLILECASDAAFHRTQATIVGRLPEELVSGCLPEELVAGKPVSV